MSVTWRLFFFAPHRRDAACQHCVNKSCVAQWQQETVVLALLVSLVHGVLPTQLFQLLRELRQLLPVEVDTVAGSRGRQSHALVESEWVFDIAVEPKAVRFEIGTIWAGGQQMDGYVMCPVASYRK